MIGVIHNTVSRYQVLTTTGLAVSVTSASQIRVGVQWAQVGTALTLTYNAHGHSVGDLAIIRNANVDYQVALITSVTANTFTVTSSGAGAAMGFSCNYTMGFTFAHNGPSGSISGGTISAPATAGADIQLMGVRIHLATGTRTGTTYTLNVPAGILNGAGGDTSMDDVWIPVQQIRQDGTTLSAVGNTIATSISGSFAAFQFGALPASATGIVILANF
jgi:hypothetical protein